MCSSDLTRIDAACDRLRLSAQPIAEIALHCGFYDQSAFTRQFKAVTGLTPGQYRKQTGSAARRAEAPARGAAPAVRPLSL